MVFSASEAHVPQRIYLVGMMGIGKSTFGRQLATYLRYHFIDTDKAIEQEECRSIQQIFEQDGESYFRETEAEVLKNTVQDSAAVIATGGGTPCFYNNMEWMNMHGTSIYMKGNAAFILSRISRNPGKRPLLKDKSKEEMGIYIEEILAQREPFYMQAHHLIELPSRSLIMTTMSML